MSDHACSLDLLMPAVSTYTLDCIFSWKPEQLQTEETTGENACGRPLGDRPHANRPTNIPFKKTTTCTIFVLQ